MKSKIYAKHEAMLKKEKLIESILSRFDSLKPSKEQREDYHQELSKLKTGELQFIDGKAERIAGKKNIRSKLSALNKKKAILITMFHINGTIGNYVISKYSRSFKIAKNTYIINTQDQYYNIAYKLQSYFFFENVPMPVSFQTVKDKLEYSVDAKALTSIIKMEYVEMLTKVAKIKDLLIITVIASCASALLSIVCIVLLVQGFNLI